MERKNRRFDPNPRHHQSQGHEDSGIVRDQREDAGNIHNVEASGQEVKESHPDQIKGSANGTYDKVPESGEWRLLLS